MQKIRPVKNLRGTSRKSSLIPSESFFVDTSEFLNYSRS